MGLFDNYLQRVRIKKAMPYIPDQAIVLDIGCHKGELFIRLGKKLGYGVGIDPILKNDIITEKYELLRDNFPSSRATKKLYHCITMLAVLEHIQLDEQVMTIKACYDLLRENGVVVVTVPDKRVDNLLPILRKLRLVEGIQIEEHYGFEASKTFDLFTTAGFILVAHKKFQFGLNNLYVFKK